MKALLKLTLILLIALGPLTAGAQKKKNKSKDKNCDPTELAKDFTRANFLPTYRWNDTIAAYTFKPVSAKKTLEIFYLGKKIDSVFYEPASTKIINVGGNKVEVVLFNNGKKDKSSRIYVDGRETGHLVTGIGEKTFRVKLSGDLLLFELDEGGYISYDLITAKTCP